MIARVEGERCWWFDFGGEPEGLHFPSREAAEKAPDRRPGAVLVQLTKPCHTAACDRCGYVEGEGEGDGWHFPADELGHVLADLEDLQPDPDGSEGALVCSVCRDKAAEPGEPLPGLELVLGGELR